MTILKQVLSNEFTRFTGQTLSDEEMQTMMDFVNYYREDNWKVKDLSDIVYSFIQECYDEHSDDPDWHDQEFTLKDWSMFPMAHREFLPDRTIISYRGGTKTIYEQGV